MPEKGMAALAGGCLELRSVELVEFKVVEVLSEFCRSSLLWLKMLCMWRRQVADALDFNFNSSNVC